MRYPDARIIVFCKAPVAGTVKTRLIPSLGEEGARQIHEELADRTIRTSMASGLAPVIIWAAPDTSHAFFRGIDGVELRAQEGDDLGARMHHALSSTLADANVARAVLIGTDCPVIDAPYLDAALVALESHDAVLGPAEDGGYGLIGLREPCGEAFTGVEWGSDRVAAQTCSRLNRKGFNWALLPLIWDVDRPEDVRRYREYE